MAKNRKSKPKKKSEHNPLGNATSISGVAPFKENRFGDLCLIALDTGRFDASGSEAFYHNAYGTELFQPETLYLFVGSDSGLLPKFIKQQGVPEQSKYLFFEPPEIYAQVVDLFSSENSGPEIQIKSSADLIETLADPGFASYIHADKNLFFESVSATEAKYLPYKELSPLVQKEWIDRIWRTKVAANQKDFIEKQLENLGENQISSICLKGAFKGMTAVLLAGGPSLDDALPWVIENRDKLVVLAISRVCRRLREVDLVPDIVFSVDPQPINYENSIDLFHFWEKTLFVNAHHVAPQLLSQWRGKSVYSGPRFPWTTPLNEETLPLANPTVTNTAFVSAVAMGFNQVVLAGVDLCHSREGHTYAKGNHAEVLTQKVLEPFSQVETNGGWRADTTADYANAIAELGLQAAEALSRDCRVFNPGIGAAVIENVSYLPLESITVAPGSILYADFIQKIPDQMCTQQIEYHGRCLFEIAGAIDSLKRIRDIINIETEKKDFNILLNVYEKLKINIEIEFSDINDLVVKYSSCDLDRIKLEKNKCCSEYECFFMYFDKYIDAIDELLDILYAASMRLTSRLEEVSDSPDVNIIFTQWDKDNSFGRAFICEKQRELNSLPSLPSLSRYQNKNLSCVEDLENSTHNLTQIDHVYVKDRLLDFFQHEDVTRIDRLSCWLENLRFSGLAEQRLFAETKPALREGSSEVVPFVASVEKRSVLPVRPGDHLFAYVLLSAENPPKGIMLQWQACGVTYRATWGDWPLAPHRQDLADELSSASLIHPEPEPLMHIHVGVLPEIGQWVLLEVPAARLELESHEIESFAVMIPSEQTYAVGAASWQCTGIKTSDGIFNQWEPAFKTDCPRVLGQGRDWFGVSPYDAGTVTSPAFVNATESFFVEKAATLFVDLWLDPLVPPRELILQWNAVGWGELKWHRAYWGENLLSWGVEGTPGQLAMGPIPMPEQPGWVRFELPAALVGLEGVDLSGMSVAHYDGVVGWGRVGSFSLAEQEICWFDKLFPQGAEKLGQGWGWYKDWLPEVKEVYQFSCALSAELNGQRVKALNIYNDMLNDLRDQALLEEVLKRILSLSLKGNDLDNGLLALQCLSDLSLSYAPGYARLLKISGDINLAIHVYESYLEQKPRDLNSMLQLGSLYSDTGSTDTARSIFQDILKQDPGNCEAQEMLLKIG